MSTLKFALEHVTISQEQVEGPWANCISSGDLGFDFARGGTSQWCSLWVPRGGGERGA